MKTQFESDGVQSLFACRVAPKAFDQDALAMKARLADSRESPFFGPVLFRFCGQAEAVPPGGKRASTIDSIRAILIQLIADERVA